MLTIEINEGIPPEKKLRVNLIMRKIVLEYLYIIIVKYIKNKFRFTHTHHKKRVN